MKPASCGIASLALFYSVSSAQAEYNLTKMFGHPIKTEKTWIFLNGDLEEIALKRVYPNKRGWIEDHFNPHYSKQWPYFVVRERTNEFGDSIHEKWEARALKLGYNGPLAVGYEGNAVVSYTEGKFTKTTLRRYFEDIKSADGGLFFDPNNTAFLKFFARQEIEISNGLTSQIDVMPQGIGISASTRFEFDPFTKATTQYSFDFVRGNDLLAGKQYEEDGNKIRIEYFGDGSAKIKSRVITKKTGNVTLVYHDKGEGTTLEHREQLITLGTGSFKIKARRQNNFIGVNY